MNTVDSTEKKPFFLYRLIKIITIVFISIYLIIWAISSPLSKHFIAPVLHEQGLTLSTDTRIYYNPFLSQLTIKNLALYKDIPNVTDQETVFSLDELTVRLTLHRLLFDEVIITEFDLNGAYLQVIKTPSQLIIAGIDLNKNSENTPQNEKKEDSPETVSEPLPYQLILPKLAVNKVTIAINNNAITHQVDIKELLISQVKASLTHQTALVSLQSAIDGTALAITAEAEFNQGQGEINSQLSITDYPIQKIQPYVKDLSELSGLLSFASNQKITITPNTLNVNISEADISNTDLLVAYQAQFFTLQQFKSNIKNLLLTLEEGEITELSAMSQLTLQNANAHYHNKENQKIAYIKQFALQDIHLNFIDGEPQINIANLIIDDTYGSKNADAELPPLVTLQQLHINDIFVNAQQLSIDKIIVDSLQSKVILNEEGALANLVVLPASEETTQTETLETTTTDTNKTVDQETIDQELSKNKTNFIVSFNEFMLINDNQFHLLDRSVEPAMQSKVIIDTLKLGAFSNANNKQEEPIPFELQGRINKYAHFDFQGFTQPFSPIQKHHLAGSLQELSLPPVSRYMKKAMNMELKSGQLNTDVKVTLTGEELDGNVLILLRSLETAIASSDEAGALIDQGALPFNMALGMLKDSHGDVELIVPLSGSTSDPNFGMSSIVSLITKKAIWMATKDYVMTTFVPYANIVSAAMTVGEFALKLRFDDLIYEAKQIEPNATQQAYLDAFIALMQNKEKTRVNICGISTPADIELNLGAKITNKEQINQLKDIAEQREAAFKDYIIEQGGIASSRLLLCAPKIDSSAKAQPRIALSV